MWIGEKNNLPDDAYKVINNRDLVINPLNIPLARTFENYIDIFGETFIQRVKSLRNGAGKIAVDAGCGACLFLFGMKDKISLVTGGNGFKNFRYFGFGQFPLLISMDNYSDHYRYRLFSGSA